MAMHDFRCEKCLYYWEEIWHLSEYDENKKQMEEKTKLCPNCQSNDIIKFFPKPSLKFSGEMGNSGFHILDYPTNVERNKKEDS